MARAAVVRAEFLKLITLPSLRWATVLTWAATALIAWAAHRADPSVHPIPAALRWTQAGFIVLGVLAATQEYESGSQIRATLLAVPRRLTLLASKAITLAAATLVIAAPLLAAEALSPSTAFPAAAHLVSVSLIGAAAGLLLRASVPAIALLLTTYLIADPLIRGGGPGAHAWLPDTMLVDPPHGAAATALWTAAVWVLATTSFLRRNPVPA